MSKISVILCTYNRAESLKDTLEALKKQAISSAHELEILVIDNNSRDRTKGVTESATGGSLFPIRYIFEANQGKSFALNRGIMESNGEYLLFTDDDIIPPTDWAETLANSFDRYQADSVGGKVLPLWQGTPSGWLLSPVLKQNVNGVLAMLDHGDEIRISDGNNENFLYGCNIGFRKSIFNEFGNYRTDLGPLGKKLFRGEDTEMMKRVLSAGKKVAYIPQASVFHKVETERMTLAYFRKRRFHGGQSDYFRLPQEKRRIPFWFIRECFSNGLKSLHLYLQGSKELAIARELTFWAQFGRIIGGLQSSWRRSL